MNILLINKILAHIDLYKISSNKNNISNLIFLYFSAILIFSVTCGKRHFFILFVI